MLHGFVDGQDDTVAVFGLIHLIIFVGHILALGVFYRDNLSGRPAEDGVVIGFQAIGPLVFRAGEAQYIGGKVIEGIVPFIILVQIDAVNLIVRLKFCNLIRQRPFNLPLDDLIVGVFAGALQDIVLIHLQKFRKIIGNQFPLLLGFDVHRGNGNSPDRGALGQNLHIPVIDGSPLRADGGDAHLLFGRQLLIIFPVKQLQLCQPADEAPEPHNTDKTEKESHALAHFNSRSFGHVVIPPYFAGSLISAAVCRANKAQ